MKTIIAAGLFIGWALGATVTTAGLNAYTRTQFCGVNWYSAGCSDRRARRYFAVSCLFGAVFPLSFPAVFAGTGFFQDGFSLEMSGTIKP